MSRKAAFSQAEATRLMKAAHAAGWAVGSYQIVVENGRLALLPAGPAVADVAASETDWSKRLNKWRRSA